ncbi:MAG: FAD-dependent oxidoreductase [candidate division KSB1 bacterium]
MKKIVVIGAGFAGIAAASVLSKHGHAVTVLEKNETLGGRARIFQTQGFTFDMGPSWYWMPDVFEHYFNLFGKTVADFYELKQLDPSYAIFFGKDEVLNVPAGMDELYALFESIKPKSGAQLQSYLREAAYKYEVGMQDLVYKPGRSLLEFADRRFLKGLFKLHVFESLHRYVRRRFSDIRLIRLLEFPVLFLGGTPKNTPALYSLMNYAGLSLGTW